LRPDAGLRKDAGWQWYNELKSGRRAAARASGSAAQMDILENRQLCNAEKALAEAICTPRPAFVKFFRLQTTGRSRLACSR
jgi:hypothetical protein